MKNNPIKIHVVGSSHNYMNWIDNAVYEPHILDAQIVLFTGGEDVHPGLYNERKNPLTCANQQRDYRELAAFETAAAHKKRMIGICRGAQLVCALSGGRLIQDQKNPGSHDMLTIDGMEYFINSLHHQAMYPYDMSKDQYKVIGWTEGLCGIHQDGYGEEISEKPFKEAEIVYFPTTKALGIQFHPEMLTRKVHERTLRYCNELVINLLNDKL